MKRIKCMFLFIMLVFLCPVIAYASGEINISTYNITIEEGSSATFNISAINAAGRVDITSTNAGIASANISNVWLDNSSNTVEVRANSIGSASIIVTLSDASTYDEEELSGTYQININVISKENKNSSNVSNYNVVNSNLKKSSNTNIKKILVNDLELETNDGITYFISLDNSINKANINVEVEDNTTIVDSIDELVLNIGENKKNFFVTAEDGTKKEYFIVIDVKDNNYYLDNINKFIDESPKYIVLKKGDIITSDILNSVKSSGLTVNFNMYDDNKFLYGYIAYGNKLNNIKDISTDVLFNFKKKYKKTSGIEVLLGKSIINGIDFKLNVSEIFSDNEVVNLYTYNSKDKNYKFVNKLTVNDQIIKFEIDNNNYYITKENLSNNKQRNHILIYTIIIFISILVIFLIVKIEKKRRIKNT